MEKDSDSTLTSLDENTENLCDNPTRDTLAEGIVSLFQPIIDQLDDRVRSTRCVFQGFSHEKLFNLFNVNFILNIVHDLMSSDWRNKSSQNNWTV